MLINIRHFKFLLTEAPLRYTAPRAVSVRRRGQKA